MILHSARSRMLVLPILHDSLCCRSVQILTLISSTILFKRRKLRSGLASHSSFFRELERNGRAIRGFDSLCRGSGGRQSLLAGQTKDQMFSATGIGLTKIRNMQNMGKRARHSVDRWDQQSMHFLITIVKGQRNLRLCRDESADTK